MNDKSLKDKAIDIKGKKYVQVSERILYFNEKYQGGSIQTDLISDPKDDVVIIKATVRPDDSSVRFFTGYSQAKWGDGMVNKTAALENAETSAVGRALAMMGIGVIESIASADEVVKSNNAVPATDKQLFEIRRLLGLLKVYDEARESVLAKAASADAASKIIGQLKEKIDNLEPKIEPVD
jgi:hypothetical protein